MSTKYNTKIKDEKVDILGKCYIEIVETMMRGEIVDNNLIEEYRKNLKKKKDMIATIKCIKKQMRAYQETMYEIEGEKSKVFSPKFYAVTLLNLEKLSCFNVNEVFHDKESENEFMNKCKEEFKEQTKDMYKEKIKRLY